MRLILAVALLTAAAAYGENTVTLTGWFSCDKCTRGRVANGDVRPSNPVCAKDCIDKGDSAMFLDEQGKTAYRVRDSKPVVDDLGFKVEVTGVVDANAKTIVIRSVKQLAADGASCGRPAARK
jgi:hypothetical protein